MFGYKECVEAIVALEKAGATAGVVGKSLLFREIPFVKIGDGDKKIIITGAIHAREWITARLVIAQAEYALKNGVKASVWFLPTINPDGVEIALGRSKPPVWFNGNVGLWKANARGVDLNVNFPARWGTGKSNTFTFMPSASSISVLLILAFIPASSPSYNKVILDVNRCNKRICSSDNAVPELATTFSKPHWCMAMTSVYPSTIYTQSFLTIALLAW